MLRLLAAQFPQWVGAPLEAVLSAGTDNALYRLDADKVVRLPRTPSAALQIAKEQVWLPRLAGRLPLETPVPVALGVATTFYPWQWSVYRWIEGEVAAIQLLTSASDAAVALGRFVTALHRIEPDGAPGPGQHNSFRGEPLRARDSATRAAIAALGTQINAAAALSAWEAALDTPDWSGPPVWIHGDLQPGNLLVHEGRLRAVIDFGLMGVGDPACDLMIAWTFLPAETRPILRGALPLDAATWARARGWALSFGLVALPYYRTTNPTLASIADYAINEVLAEHASETQ